MDNLFDLIHLKNSLPKGDIYTKKINGREYYYHQYRDENRNYCIKLSDSEAILLMLDINKRKYLEERIKAILDKGYRSFSLSKSAMEYTGQVMSGDIVVATFYKNKLIGEIHPNCPLYIKRTHSLEGFLRTRTIDQDRANSRLLKKMLNITTLDEGLISLCSYAASISDNYWFKPMHSKLKYEDICFNNDIFFDTALKGLITIYPRKIILTPELTTNGSYEKGWKNDNGLWWLYKIEDKNERYSEMFYSRLFEALNLPTAHYELEDDYIKTLNFSNNMNFEPMISIAGENENIDFIYSLLNDINHNIALDYLRLVVFDIVLNNVDRHNENLGLLRDRRTGKIISLAPNYDNNLCLISRSTKLDLSNKEGFLNFFIDLIKTNDVLLNALKEISFPIINEEILDNVNKRININIDIDFNIIKQYILNRYNYILNIINRKGK